MQCSNIIYLTELGDTSKISPELLISLQKCMSAETVESQIKHIKQISSFLSRSAIRDDDKIYIINLFVKCLLETSNKHPVRKTISRIFISLQEYHNDIVQCLSQSIVRLIDSIQDNDGIVSFIKVLNVISGCFENFHLGEEAIKRSVAVVLPFLIGSLKKFVNIISISQSLQNKADISIQIHILCRSLVSVLTHNTFDVSSEVIVNLMKYCYLIIDDPHITIDTKCNCGIIFVLSAKRLDGTVGWTNLLKMCLDNNESVGDYLREFSFSSAEQKVCICSGILNTQSIQELSEPFKETDSPLIVVISSVLFGIIEGPSSKLSTEVILAFSRSILIVTNSLENLSSDHRNSILKRSLDYIWTHLEHYIDTVRHIVKSTFINIVRIAVRLKRNGDAEFLESIKKNVVLLPKNRSAYYICLGILGVEDSCTDMLEHNPNMISELLNSMHDSCISSYASTTYEDLMKCSLKWHTSTRWIEIWILPILNHLSATKTDSVDIFLNLLAKAISFHPDVGSFILAQFERNVSTDLMILSPEILLACVKVIRKKGSLDKLSVNASEHKWRGLLDIDFLKAALCCNNDQVRLLACGVIVESHKSTEIFLKQEFLLLLTFLEYNVNVQEPSVRQQIIAYMKKLFSRIKESFTVIQRTISNKARLKQEIKNVLDMKNISNECHLMELEIQKKYYQEFILELRNFLMRNLFPGANFSRRVSVLEMLKLMKPVFASILGEVGFIRDEYEAKNLFENLSDSFEHNKSLVVDVITDCPVNLLGFDKEQNISASLRKCMKLASSVKPIDCITAAYHIHVLVHYPVMVTVLQKTLEKPQETCPYLLMISLLLDTLEKQLEIAKQNLLIAASNGPLYGLLFCTRYLFEKALKKNLCSSENWNDLVKSLIRISFELSDTVTPIVNNASPEGYFPHDDAVKMEQAVTPQMVLICAWRTVKEVSLLLGEISLNVSICNDSTSDGIITEQQLIDIGDHFITLLAETKHRGAFEQAYVGFTKLSHRLWKCHSESLSQLPKVWLEDLIGNITSNDITNTKLCATRRSAGVPFMVQALVSTELQVRLKPVCFENCMETLLKTASDQSEPNLVACTHSMNILRALFRQAELGELVTKYVAEGVQIAVRGISGFTWAVRNAATLLFSSLMIRIFGVQRSRDTLSARNKMTVRVFFLRYPTLYNFLLNELESACKMQNGQLINLSLYPILLLLARLYPSVLEGNESQSQIEAFIPFVMECSRNSVMKTRNLAAKAIVPLFSDLNIVRHMLFLLKELGDEKISKNTCHGYLLQFLYMLRSLPKDFEHVTMLCNNIIKIEWIIISKDRNVSYVLLETYCEIFSELISKFRIDNSEFNMYLYRLYEFIEETSVVSRNVFDIGISGYNSTSVRLQFHIKKLLISDDIEASAQEFLELIVDKMRSKHEIYVGFVTSILICLFDINDYLLEEVEISTREIHFVESLNTQLKQKLKNNLIKNTDILNTLESESIENQIILSKMYLLKGFFMKDFDPCVNINDILGGLIKECYAVHESLSCSILYYIGHVLERVIENGYILDDGIAADLCNLFFDYACPQASYSCRYTVAFILTRNKRFVLNSNEFMKGVNICTIWMVSMMLVEDMERPIRDCMSGLLSEDGCYTQVYPDVAREKLIDLSIHIIGNYSLEYCTALLLLWLLRDTDSQDDSNDDDEGRVFDKGEMNTYAEDIVLARYACKHFTSLLEKIDGRNHYDRVNYILKVLKQDDISGWLSTYADSGKISLIRSLDHFISNNAYILVDQDYGSECNEIVKYKLFLLQNCIMN